MDDEFEIIHRLHGDCWKHKEQDYWIVFYESQHIIKRPSYYAYRPYQNESCEGRDPWTVNNRCVGRFYTLKEAMLFSEQ
jgi:hypothetical protein